MNDISTVEYTVMRRVHRVHALRPFLRNAALAVVLFVLALYGVGREVWVARVLQNAPHASVLDAVRFFVYAFLDTRLVVQVLVLAALVALIWFFRDLIRIARTSPRYA